MEHILSPEFSRLVGVYRFEIPGFPKIDAAPVDEWNDSEQLRNTVAFLTLAQMDVMEDYGFLLQRLDSIREAIVNEARRN